MSGRGEPTAVILWMRDGSMMEQVFATRFLAEMFVFLLPYLATTQPDDAENGVAAAMISPLIPSNSTGLDGCRGMRDGRGRS